MGSKASLVIVTGDVFSVDGKGSIIIEGLYILDCRCGAIDVLWRIWLARPPRLCSYYLLRWGPVTNSE